MKNSFAPTTLNNINLLRIISYSLQFHIHSIAFRFSFFTLVCAQPQCDKMSLHTRHTQRQTDSEARAHTESSSFIAQVCVYRNFNFQSAISADIPVVGLDSNIAITIFFSFSLSIYFFVLRFLGETRAIAKEK